VVAERFRLLDQVPVPDLGPLMASTPAATPGPSSGRRRVVLAVAAAPGRRRFVLAVAAAAAVLALATGAFVAALGDDNSSVEVAGELVSTDVADVAEGGGSTDGSASSSSDDGENRRGSTLLVPQASRSENSPTSTESGDGDGDRDGVSTDVIDAADGDGGSATPSTTVVDPPDSEPTIRSSVTTMPPETSSPDTSIPKTTVPETTVWETSVPETTVPEGELRSLTGIVTEVMLDCQRHLVLNERGEVVDGPAIMCDGGSFIVVNDVRIFTTSGYVPADMAFNKHPEGIKPGQRVSVIGLMIGPRTMTLNCDRCGVRIIG